MGILYPNYCAFCNEVTMVLQKRTQSTPFLIEWNVNRMVNRVLLLMTVMSMEHLADSVSEHMLLKMDIGQFCVYCYNNC